MISEMREEEMLEFLMTSEFIDPYRPEEFKDFLMKFRLYYRLLYGRHTLMKSQYELENDQLKKTIDFLKIDIENTQISKKNIEDKFDQVRRSRQLSWKERITGKTKEIK